MNIENMLIEHWPRLQSANFYLLFTENLAQTSKVRVRLRSTTIDIHIANIRTLSIALSTVGLQIQVNSLSLLIVKNNLISFRANTCADDNFHREMLDVPELPTIQNTLVKLPINVEPQQEFIVKCKNCHCPLSVALMFERVLELPSENMDLSEWYCHKPMNKHETGELNDDNHDHHDHDSGQGDHGHHHLGCP